MSGTEQTAVIDFLTAPATHGGAALRRVDTHISVVVLAGDRAIKLKKAVKLPFLDFTALETREWACRREVELNRRTAPDLYLGVEAVRRRPDGSLGLGGAGEVLDWVVLMRRFPDGALLSDVAARDGLSRGVLEELAEAVARFHAEATAVRTRGGAAAIRRVIAGNARTLDRFKGPVFAPEEVDRVIADSLDLANAQAARLDHRRDAGLVRQCHGDLHLGNICLLDGRPVIFDCIEFNEDFAIIDVLYDFAFLLMDLHDSGLTGDAAIVFNHYMERAHDLDGLALLPLFLSMRAQIRAHVTATMADSAENPAALHERARAYLRRAAAYLRPPPPRLAAVGGLSGSGKSRCARALSAYFATAPGAVVLRSDVIRKRLAGVAPTDRLPQSAYTPAMSERTYATLYADAATALRAGHAVIADAVFAKPAERAAIERVAADAGVPFAGLWLEARPDVAARRIAGRSGNASDATVEVLTKQLSYDLGDITWTRVDSSGSKAATDRAARAALDAAFSDRETSET